MKDLSQIAADGDLETQNAIDGLQAAVETLAGDPESGRPMIDAHQSLLDALDNVAARCEAVGSSALQ